MSIPRIFGDSFNASQNTVEELCNSFIVNEYFDKLTSPNHALMIGPRGSGKTTLLRMLQVDALDLWSSTESIKFKEKINFSGVFVPTDRLWKDTYDEYKKQIKSISQAEDILNNFFIYHTLLNVINVLRYKTDRELLSGNRFRHLDLSKTDESELVGELSKSWHVSPSRNTLRSLASSIILKNEELSAYFQTIVNGTENRDDTPKYFSNDLIGVIKSAIKTINLFLGNTNVKWAILFDELELAPEKLVNSLISSLRGSGSEDVIFKLAISPYHKNIEITKYSTSPMTTHDFTWINLSETDEKQGLEFSTKLCEQVFKNSDLNEPIRSYFEESSYSKNGLEKSQRSLLKTVFHELNNKDASFNNYLSRKNIEIEKIPSYTDKDKATILRKIQYIAAIRNFYLNDEGSLKSRRRAFDYYAGFEHICKALEYNPRMLIGIMIEFARIATKSSPIPIDKQLSELNNFYESFRSLLETIAITEDALPYDNLYELIKAIGTYFQKEMLSNKFNDEPKGSIILSSPDKTRQYFSAIGSALNAGALVMIGSNKRSPQELEDLTGARCRLSHLFSHAFKLTMTTQREIDLNKIVSSKNNSVENKEQMDLL